MSSSFLYPISKFLCSRSCSYHWLVRLYILEKKVNWSIFLWSVTHFFSQTKLPNPLWREFLALCIYFFLFLNTVVMYFCSVEDKNPFYLFTQLRIISGPLYNISSMVLPALIYSQVFLFFFKSISNTTSLCFNAFKWLFCDLLITVAALQSAREPCLSSQPAKNLWLVQLSASFEI